MITEAVQIERSLQFTLKKLREQLARRNFAFGALFIAVTENAVNVPQGHMILMAEELPANVRIQMLTDLIEAAQSTIEHYRKAS